MRKPKSLKEVAYHESAHAITALHCGFEVPEMDIVGNDEYFGLTHITVTCDYSKGKEYIHTIFNDAVVDLAGHAADVRNETYTEEEEWEYFVSTDFKVAREKIRFYVAAKYDLIEPSEYHEVEANRMTAELFQQFFLGKRWNKINRIVKVEKAFNRAGKKAKRMVDQHWSSIGLLANQLLTQKQIIYDSEIRTLLTQNGFPPPTAGMEWENQ
jgi:ATP-dependent Zn protease